MSTTLQGRKIAPFFRPYSPFFNCPLPVFAGGATQGRLILDGPTQFRLILEPSLTSKRSFFDVHSPRYRYTGI